jgi:hypothetical protein
MPSRSRPRRFRARRHHHRAHRRASQIVDQLAAADSPRRRADALVAWAHQEQQLADTSWAFADAAELDTDGVTLGESHLRAARVLRIVAGTEMDLIAGRSLTGVNDELEVPAHALLRRLTRERDLSARTQLVIALYDALVDHVGGQAAEVLGTVAYCYAHAAGLTHDQTQALLSPRPQPLLR